jgi:hypothetical protein
MKKIALIFVLVLIQFNINAQVISLTPHNSFLSDTLGSEMIFAVDVTNISQEEQTIYIVRTINALPSEWTSALCFDVCFTSELDSAISIPDYGSSPVLPDSTREISIHVFPEENHGAGNVQIKVGSTSDNIDYFFDFEASTLTTSVDDPENKPENFRLLQNYPNPFNPATKISWQSPVSSWQTLKIYDALGNEVSTLVNQEKPAGVHTITFDASDLSSGIYFYQLITRDFTETKKMILLR